MPSIQAVSYHPLFSSPDADVVFRSSEGTYYRMHSFVLWTTSGFFRPMLSLKNIADSGSRPDLSSEDSPIALDENDGVLERLFSMMSGMVVPCWDSLEEMEGVLYAAEKYDTPGPTSIIRSAITSPRFMADPLRVYAIAARYHWEEWLLQYAAEACLAIPIHQQKHVPVLKRVPTDDLLRLIDLRRERRDVFINAIDNAVQFTRKCNTQTCGCGKATDHRGWSALKLAMYMEMDERPIGTVLRNMYEENWEAAAEACWNHHCRHCGRLVYDQMATMKCIRLCIDKLPLRLRPKV
ncbi:hypothetical protein DFH29DRAFT_851461 [Suillus ampliporus]|nr:hypothetical protein DFH29DRAFT_851461 [Suillus ampliporus]